MENQLDSIIYVTPTQDQYEDVLNAVYHFFDQEETAMKARGGHPGGLPECMRKKYIGMLQDNVSIIAIDTSKYNDICGIMLSSLAIKDSDESLEKPSYAELLEHYPEIYAMIGIMCNEAFYAPEFFRDVPQLEKVVDLYAIGVCAKYRQRGIAKRLVQESMKAAKNKGCDGAVITASNPVTNKIAQFMNMTVYKDVLWADFRDEKTGEEWFPAEKLPDCKVIMSYYKSF